MMNFKWLNQITDQSKFATNYNPQFTNIKRVQQSGKIDSERTLSPLEQLYLAPYYIINLDGMSHTFERVEEYGIKKIEPCLELFNKVTYLYDNEVLKFITISNPKEKSLDLFKKQAKTKKLNNFVKSLFLSPHDKLSMLSNEEIFSEGYIANQERVTYSLNTDFVEKTDIEEVDKDFLDFFKYCYPEAYGVKPNKLLMNESVLNNYAVRLLATIYKNVYFVVDNQTNIIIYIMGKNINKNVI